MKMHSLVSKIYSGWLAKSLVGYWDFSRVFFSRELFRIRVIKARNTRVVLEGRINFRSHLGSTEPVRIILEEGSTLVIEGDLEIGAGTVILVRAGGFLRFGGRKKSTASGMASHCKIIVKDSVDIGNDVIMGWDVLVTDSDWHTLEGSPASSPVVVEDKVWLSHHVSVHKGAHISSGSLVSAHSLVLGPLPERVLAGGIPAKILRENIRWDR